jgi:uncharacterized protein (TIGR03083 family)
VQGERYDAVVVGARCAGATMATLLARAGQRVLLVDRDTFPSDTVSTHQLFPDSLHLLDQLGAGDRLRAAHRLRPVEYSWRVLGHAVAGSFTPVGHHDRTMSVRRIALDAVLVQTAVDAGAELRAGCEVTDLLGSGSPDDPVRGVVLRGEERVGARWVLGADGRTSTVARRLGLPRVRERRGEMAMLLAYWSGLPDADWCHIDVHAQAALMSAPCEDGLHLLSVAGPPELSRGSASERQQAYATLLRRFPATLNPRLLDRAQQVSDLIAVPETMLRGFERQAAGPGWALAGDAGLFKHPVTAQGIGDALAQGWYVGTALARGETLDDYAAWRAERAAGHFEWSYDAARFPSSRAAAIYSGLVADQAASTDFLDTFTKRVRPSEVFTKERLARWQAAWTYEQGLRELLALLDGVEPEVLLKIVPACPDWTVGDLTAHLIGVAEDTARGNFFPGALNAWQDTALAQAREEWTAGHLVRHAARTRDALVRGLQHHGTRLVDALRAGREPLVGQPHWLVVAPVGDLAVHLADLREALGVPSDPTSPVARFGFAIYRDWLHQRLVHEGLPALLLRDGHREWPVGEGDAVDAVTAESHELFRMISGRRSAASIAGYEWSTDHTAFLPVIAPYPLPT